MNPLPPPQDIRSLWWETAVPAMFEPLAGDRRYDVAIIGGGFTGLTTARYLAKSGLSPVVLESNRIGWGASGRNGGVVSGKFRLGYKDIAARFDLDTARRMRDLGYEAVDHVAELIDDYKINSANFRQNGLLRCAHNAHSMEAIRSEAEWLRETLGDTASRILSAGEIAEETGSTDFVGGILNTHGGIIHPLNYVLGIANGLKTADIAVHERSPVTALRRDGDGVVLETPNGTIRATQAVVATNSYSDLTAATNAVRTGVVPFRSAMIATAPLAGTPGAGLLKSDRSYSETRRMMRWFRKTDGRMLYGGRGAFGKKDSDAAFNALRRAMVRQFPELRDTPITHRWSGLVAMTLDTIPHLGRLDDKVVYCVGYNGTGVAMSSNMGKYVAKLVRREQPNLGLITSQPLPKIPFYGLREPAIRLVAGWYQFLDAIGH